MANPGASTGEAAGDTFYSIERIHGGSGNDSITGNSGNNYLYGENGNDTIYGGAGRDVLVGNAGNDRLNGGSGNDRFYGNTGADTFIFSDGFGADRIHDFDAHSSAEKIDLAGVSSITSFADLTANHMSQIGSDVLIDAGGGNSITLHGLSLADLDASDFLF